jgi:CheY-like chemotaxis protein
VVDDEKALLEVATALLKPMGYTLYAAENGDTALNILKQKPYIDLLFSDILMSGGMNGYELAEQATKQHPKLKVLLTSGYTESIEITDCQATFSVNILKKPYSQETLAKQIRGTLDS